MQLCDFLTRIALFNDGGLGIRGSVRGFQLTSGGIVVNTGRFQAYHSLELSNRGLGLVAVKPGSLAGHILKLNQFLLNRVNFFRKLSALINSGQIAGRAVGIQQGLGIRVENPSGLIASLGLEGLQTFRSIFSKILCSPVVKITKLSQALLKLRNLRAGGA